MKWNEKKPYIYGMLAGFGAISLSVLFFFVIYRFQGFSGAIQKLMNILAPFVYGAAIAYVLRPLCNFYSEFLNKHLPQKIKKISGGASVALSILTAFLILYLLVMLIIPQVITSVMTLVNTAPANINKFMAWLQELLASSPDLQKTINDLYASIADTLDEWVRTTLVPTLRDALGGFGMGLLNVGVFFKNVSLGLIVAIYLLAARHKFSRQAYLVLYSIVKRSWADVIHEELVYANRVFQGFISGKLLDSLIIGLICYVFCLITGMPGPMLIAVIVGVTNIIPFFGPFIGAVPSILLILIESPIKSLWFLVFVIILQQFDGNILGPKILGNTTGVSSFWVLFSILLFGGLWGVFGMLVGVPLFAVIYDILRKLIFRGLRRNNCEDMLIRYNRKFGDPPDTATAPAEEPKSSE